MAALARERERDESNGSVPSDVHAAAHELRTPLTAILGYAELLACDEVWFDRKQRDAILARIITNAMAQRRIIERWLDGDETTLAPAIVPLLSDVEELIADLEPLVGRHPFDVQIPSDLHVFAERGVLREILSNLLTNAAKYSPALSLITVAARRTAGSVSITIHNDGKTLAEEELDHIFENGYRARRGAEQPASEFAERSSANLDYRAAPDTSTPGSGLGLSIARALVTQLGGQIWAETSDDGTDFVFTLPAPQLG